MAGIESIAVDLTGTEAVSQVFASIHERIDTTRDMTVQLHGLVVALMEYVTGNDESKIAAIIARKEEVIRQCILEAVERADLKAKTEAETAC